MVSLFALLALLGCLTISVASATELTIQARDIIQLADGKSLQTGKISNGLSWQASGILNQGCKDSAAFPIAITDYYFVVLSPDPAKNLYPGGSTPRQRIEFFTLGAADGTTHKFKWRYYLSSTVGTSSRFFHLMQLLSRGDGGPIVALDALNGQVTIQDFKRSCSTTGCPSIPLASFTDRRTVHFLSHLWSKRPL